MKELTALRRTLRKKKIKTVPKALDKYFKSMVAKTSQEDSLNKTA